MMKMQVYTIFDSAAGVYLRPFFCNSDGSAKRMFSDIAIDAEHEVGRHPEDYSLCRIGRYDDASAKLDAEDVEVLATGLAVVASARNVNKDNLELFDKQLPKIGPELRTGNSGEQT